MDAGAIIYKALPQMTGGSHSQPKGTKEYVLKQVIQGGQGHSRYSRVL